MSKGNHRNRHHNHYQNADSRTPQKTFCKPRNGDDDNRIVGIVVENHGKLQVNPCDKKMRNVYFDLAAGSQNSAKAGDVVVTEKNHQSGSVELAVKRVLGQKSSPGILSLISLYEKGLSEEFSQAAMKEAKAMAVPDLEDREDMRAIPLVTIDGPDSRDFDDAVFAEKTADGGFHLIVAIADVAWYVKPGSALDKEAYKRGNSTYLPDRAVPMLPEDLSNGLCSLKPHEDRACMAFHLYVDKDGQMTSHKIVRGLMRSAARLTYEQVQEAKDGKTDAVTAPLMDTVINPLYDAFTALRAARKKRGAMELDMPEHKVSVDASGNSVKVSQRARPESCKVIEEFMVLANVAAATTLEAQQAPCVYRVHDQPPFPDKLREYLDAFGLSLPAGDIDNAGQFKDVIEKASQMPQGHMIIKAIQRAQSKAKYDTNNIGHFGLALEKYAHFTSPIRRYADLLVHRSLVMAFNLGAGGLNSAEATKVQEMAEHISETETISAKVERNAHERYAAQALSSQVGKTFTGRIVSATNAGIFVKLSSSGTDGLLPMGNLPKDYYNLDRDQNMLVGRDSGRIYRAGAEITVRLKAADGLTGGILLEAANDNSADVAGLKFKPKAPKAQHGNNRPRR